MAAVLPVLTVLLALSSPVANAGDTVRGQETYRKQCAACHGDNGRPVVPGAPDFSRRTTLLKPDPMLLKAIREGKGPMPAYEGILRDTQILDVIAYLRTLS